MKSLFSYLLIMFVGIFWMFRVAVALMFSLEKEFIATPLNETYEIILLFITLIPIILIIKRKLIGGIIYLIINWAYFGMHIINSLPTIMESTAKLTNYTDIIFSFIGVLLPVLIIIDLLLDRTRLARPSDKKTDWFYNNKDYERKLDERADNNNYKIL